MIPESPELTRRKYVPDIVCFTKSRKLKVYKSKQECCGNNKYKRLKTTRRRKIIFSWHLRVVFNLK